MTHCIRCGIEVHLDIYDGSCSFCWVKAGRPPSSLAVARAKLQQDKDLREAAHSPIDQAIVQHQRTPTQEES